METKLPIVFVITPFSEECLAVYNELKNKFEDKYIFTNAGDLDNQRNILQDIVSGIHQADVIIADLSGLNANVFYELGLAHAMNKKVIIITQDINDLPFDICSYRANEYSLQFNKFPILIDKLTKLLNGAIDESIKYGNPIIDYLPDYFSNNCSIETIAKDEDTNTNDIINNDDDGGFLDYISDITDYSKNMVDEIYCISDELNVLSSSINDATADINRVKSHSGSTDITFMRNVCRKLSEPVDNFAQNLNYHTMHITDYWSKIENSFLSLLDNKFMQTSNNKLSVQANIDELLKTKAEIIASNDKVINFTNVLKSSIGIERKLTKAITTLIYELESYLSMTNMMSSSIDRINAKSQVIFSD